MEKSVSDSPTKAALHCGQKLWQPDPAAIEASYLYSFANFAAKKYHQDLGTWDKLYQWSIRDLANFWQAVADFTQLRWQRPPVQALDWSAALPMRQARWFPSGQLNFAENLLPPPSERLAVIALNEQGEQRSYTAAQLYEDVAACARALQKIGVQKGDKIAAVLGSGYEAIVAMLASTALGAVWSSCSPDFGVAGIMDRFGQLDPKVIFWQCQYTYQGKHFTCLANLKACLEQWQAPPCAVLLNPPKGETTSLASPSWGFSEFLDLCPEDERKLSIAFATTDFDHPLYIMFSSGTTGKPKAIVHGVGGTLLQHKKELMLHCNLGEGDRFLYYTTCGWMMWNWMVSALSLGTTLVTFDGSPSYPDLGVLWRSIATLKLTVFGTSPKFLSACMQAGLCPQKEADLTSLRLLLATGSPLVPEHYAWAYENLKPDLHVASISGGTDILSCFMLGNPYLPVHAGEIQGPGLGMDIHAWDEAGQEVRGQKGELVCTSPFVSMPLSFLDDPTGKKFHSTYFAYFPGRDVWRHGDFCEFTAHGGVIVYGRSDATLNPAGVRMGTSELYRQVEQLAAIADAVAVEWRGEGEGQIALFVVLKEGWLWDESLAEEIRKKIRHNLTPRHVPKLIYPMSAIPYTRSGKKVELAVAKAIHGERVENTQALINPEVLQEYYDWHKVALGQPLASQSHQQNE